MLAGNGSIRIGNLFSKQSNDSLKTELRHTVLGETLFLFYLKQNTSCQCILLDISPPSKRQAFVTMKNQWLSLAKTLWSGQYHVPSMQLHVKNKFRCTSVKKELFKFCGANTGSFYNFAPPFRGASRLHHEMV